MRDSMDIFGEVVKDYHQGKEAVVTIIRDDGYTDDDSAEGYFRSYEDFHPFEKEALKLVKGRVLDVGCGPGRVALHLQSKGFEVTGIDRSEMIVQVAKERGLKDCRLMDAKELSFKDEIFDTVLMMGNNFGIVGSKNKTMKLLKDLHQITSKWGRLLAHSIIPGAHMSKHRPYLKWNLERGRDIGLIRLVFEYKGQKGKPFDLLLVSPIEMMELCEDTGWELKDVFLGEWERGDFIALLEKAP